MQKHSIKICCFVGHRKIDITIKLRQELYDYIKNLIVNENVKVFLFGSRSQFNELCYEIVCELQEKYPDIQKIYVRSQYEYISKDYENYLLNYYEKTYFPDKCKGAGKLSHAKRNEEMIDKSYYCLFYYNENYLPPKRKWAKRDLFEYQPQSGTAIAYKYATSKHKEVINIFKFSSVENT